MPVFFRLIHHSLPRGSSLYYVFLKETFILIQIDTHELIHIISQNFLLPRIYMFNLQRGQLWQVVHATRSAPFRLSG